VRTGSRILLQIPDVCVAPVYMSHRPFHVVMFVFSFSQTKHIHLLHHGPRCFRNCNVTVVIWHLLNTNVFLIQNDTWHS